MSGPPSGNRLRSPLGNPCCLFFTHELDTTRIGMAPTGIQPPAQHPTSGLFFVQHFVPLARAIVAHVRASWISPGPQAQSHAAVKAPRQIESGTAGGKAGPWPPSIVRRGQGNLPLQPALAPFRSAWMAEHWPAVSAESKARADESATVPAEPKPALDKDMIERVVDASAVDAPAALAGKELGVGLKVEVSVDAGGHLQCTLLDAEPLAELDISKEMWHAAADLHGPLGSSERGPVTNRSPGRAEVWRLAGLVRHGRITIKPMMAETLRAHTWPRSAKDSKPSMGYALANRERLADNGFGEEHLEATSRWASGLFHRVLSRLDLDAERTTAASSAPLLHPKTLPAKAPGPVLDDDGSWLSEGEKSPQLAPQKTKLALGDTEDDMGDWGGGLPDDDEKPVYAGGRRVW